MALLADDGRDEMSAEDLVHDGVVAVLAQRVHLSTNFVVHLRRKKKLSLNKNRDIQLKNHKILLKVFFFSKIMIGKRKLKKFIFGSHFFQVKINAQNEKCVYLHYFKIPTN